ALSVAAPLADWPVPSALSVASAAQLWIPESVSAQMKCAVTSLLYQPAALGEGVAAPLIVGAVLSMLIPETVVLALLPALSSAVPLADWAAPSALRVIGLVQLAIPERTSEQRKLAVTSLLFQPLALAAGLRLPLIVGAVLSMLTLAFALALLQALSVAVPLTLWLATSALSVTSARPLAIT